MTPRQWRWFLVALLLGLGGAAACWVWLLDASQPPHQPPKVLAAPRWPASQAVAAASAQSRVAVAPVAASAPASQPSAPEIHIGSEGYGVHIERALESGDPGQAWQAMNWLMECALSRRLAKGVGARAPAPPADAVDEFMRWERRCQTVTSAHRAATRRLALVATQGQMPGGAAMAAWLNGWDGLDEATKDRLRSLIQRDLRLGVAGTHALARRFGSQWGLKTEDWLIVEMLLMQLDVDRRTMEGALRIYMDDASFSLPAVDSAVWKSADAAVRRIQLQPRELGLMDMLPPELAFEETP